MKKLSVLLIAFVAVILWWWSRPIDRSIDTESSRQGSEIERPMDDGLVPLDTRMAPPGASDDRASGLNESASGEITPPADSNPRDTEDRSISGRVLFADGTPLVGHKVFIGSTTHNSARWDAVIVLDASGSFEARELKEDTYTVFVASYWLGEQGEKHDVPVPTAGLEFKIDALALTIRPPAPRHNGDRSGSWVRTRFNAFGTEHPSAVTGSRPWPLQEAVQFIVPTGPGYRMIIESEDRSWPALGATFEPGLPAGAYTTRLTEHPGGLGTVEVVVTGEMLEPSTRLVVTLEASSRLSPREGDFQLSSDARAQSNTMIVPGAYRVAAELRGDPPFSMAHAIARPGTIDVAADEVTTIDIELRPTGSVRATIVNAEPNSDVQFRGTAHITRFDASSEEWKRVAFGQKDERDRWNAAPPRWGSTLTAFEPIPPGPQRFRLEAEGWSSNEVSVEVLTQTTTDFTLEVRKE